MREIKFRVWDGEKMQTRCTLLVDISDGALLDSTKDDYVDWPIMQYTGLKAKNGKEIYEGDFIKVFSHTYEVSFEKRTASFHMQNLSGGMQNDNGFVVNPSAEIIGNIYEGEKDDV